MALRLNKSEDIKLNPLASYGAAVNKADIFGGSSVDKNISLGIRFAPQTPDINVPLNFIGRKYIRAPMLGGLQYQPMHPNTSSQKIKDSEILHTRAVKKHYS